MDEYQVKYTNQAGEDLERLMDFILNRQQVDLTLAEKALDAIESTIEQLAQFPYNYRKVLQNNSYLREVIIPFTGTGYIAMYEIDPIQKIVWVLGIRHQREDDYH